MGEEHYFGKSRNRLVDPTSSVQGEDLLKKGKLDEEMLGGFVSVDDDLLIFYLMEYLVSLVTGIFDNLAIETANLYSILFPEKNKISLSNIAGRDFLREVKDKNASLKGHIDNNGEFINLIHECREKVVHREGFKKGSCYSRILVQFHRN